MIGSKVLLIVSILALSGCPGAESKVETGEDDHTSWRNTYPIAGDTSIYQHEAFYSDGMPLHSVNYVNGKRDGFFRSWDPTGAVLFEGSYVEGKKHGVWMFYDNGLQTQRTYLNDKLDGYTIEELPDGRTVYGQYDSGSESGIWIWRRANSIQQTAIYREGKYDGVMRGFWPNGMKQIEANYSSDSLVGEVLYWDTLGKPTEKKNIRLNLAL